MAKKNKIPKKVAGFRVPKAMRKSRMLRSLLSSPLGRDLLANAITAGAGAAAAVLVQERGEVASAGKQLVRKTAGAAGIATEMVQSAGSAVMGVLSDAADAVLPKNQQRGGQKKAAGH
ncbi:hypothetical protein FJ934_19915 [Mesorhizobium sp. B2-4-12]|uniref:hypothetical protein n=1 Tax=unclassified Mesorhizobium TaxID=325217 RepID=UPI00112B9CA1|nr:MULTISPECIES: hypothetical protein [unclassified Mesorhizobium]TPK88726.1 hypothetical protein FJ548_12405 [Mesorhizobium sp. B2-4-17]TPK92907.1 hypothetical protein FJ934_19915 [Mesorhizobium sp. B2-4-12]